MWRWDSWMVVVIIGGYVSSQAFTSPHQESKIANQFARDTKTDIIGLSGSLAIVISNGLPTKGR